MLQRPRWRLIGETYEVVLTAWGAPRELHADALTVAQAMRAIDALLSLASQGIGSRVLAGCARYVTERYGRVVPIAGDDRAVVRAALARGVLTAWRTRLQHVAAPTPGDLDSDAIERIPLASALLPKTWIEIELTDMEGNPMPGERYWIQTTDGRVHEGALDKNGRAYFGDLDPGQCEIRWPDRDDEATVPARAMLDAPPPREKTWIEIELTDMEGNPMPGEAYWIKTPDGRVRQGKLDRAGRAYFADVDPGQCEVRWPNLDDDAHVAALDATVGHPESNDNDAQAQTLIDAARDGVPFCEECERARRAQARSGARA